MLERQRPDCRMPRDEAARSLQLGGRVSGAGPTSDARSATEAALKPPWGPDAAQSPHDQAQVEADDVDQDASRCSRAPQVSPAKPTGRRCERSASAVTRRRCESVGQHGGRASRQRRVDAAALPAALRAKKRGHAARSSSGSTSSRTALERWTGLAAVRPASDALASSRSPRSSITVRRFSSTPERELAAAGAGERFATQRRQARAMTAALGQVEQKERGPALIRIATASVRRPRRCAAGRVAARASVEARATRLRQAFRTDSCTHRC